MKKARAAAGGVAGWLKKNLGDLSTADFEKHMNKIADWGADALATIDFDDLLAQAGEAGEKAIAATAAAWKNMDKTQLEKLKGMAADKWAKVLKDIPSDQIIKVGMDAVNQLDTSQVQAFKDQLAAITLEDVASWADEKFKEIPIDNLAEMSWKLLQKIPADEIGTWTQENWNKIPVDKLIHLTGEQLKKIDAAKVTELGDKFWDGIPVYAMTKFSVELLQSGDFLQNMDAEHVAAITSEQWKDFPLDKMAKFTIEQIQGVDYEALGEWTKDKWDALPIEKLSKMAGKQIAQIDAGTVGAWTKDKWVQFPADRFVMFTGEQIKAGATVIKDFTDEQLAQFDLEEFKGDVMAALPQDVQDRITKLQASDEMKEVKKTLKKLYDELAVLKKDAAAKYQAWQTKLEDKTATEPQKAEAMQAYEAATVTAQKKTAEVTVSENTINGVENTPSGSSRVAPALAAIALVAVASF